MKWSRILTYESSEGFDVIVFGLHNTIQDDYIRTV